MKKLINLIALVMLVSTNVLTPFSYAQEETPEAIPENEVGNVEEIGETREKDNEITGEIPNSLWEVEWEWSLPLVREVVNGTSPAKQGENLEGLKEEVEDSLDDVESPAPDEDKKGDSEKSETDEVAQPVEENAELEKQEEDLEWDEVEESTSLQKVEEPTIMEEPWTSATLLPWQQFNQTIKRLAWQSRAIYKTSNSTIKQIVYTWTIPSWVTTTWISTSDSEKEIIAWYDDWIIYYHTEAEKIYMNSDSSYMFYYMQWLTGLDLSNIYTDNVINMSNMFYECSSLVELDLSDWDTNNVTDMWLMFYRCTNLETIYAGAWFKVSNVNSVDNVFISPKLIWWNWTKNILVSRASSIIYAKIDEPWQLWYFTNKNAITVKFMVWMDEYETQVVHLWDVALKPDDPKREWANFLKWIDEDGNEYDFTRGVEKYTELYAKFSGWNEAIFMQWSQFNEVIENLAGNAINQIVRASSIPEWVTTTGIAVPYSDNEIVAWYDSWIVYYYTKTDKIFLNKDSSQMFYDMDWLTYIDMSWWDTSNVINMSNMFSRDRSLTWLDLSDWDTSNVTKMDQIFFDCEKLVELNIKGWDTSNVTEMGGMFAYCDNLEKIWGIEDINTHNVIDMNQLFYVCPSLIELDLSNWDTSNVTIMDYMFYGSYNIKNLNLSWRDFRKHMNGLSVINFYSLPNLEELNLANARFSWQVNRIFQGLSKLKKLNLEWSDVSNVTSMTAMFAGCSSLTELDLSSWDTSNVKQIYQIFAWMPKLRTIYASDSFIAPDDASSGMFGWTTSVVWWNWTKFDSWYTDKTYALIDKVWQTWYFTDKNAITVKFINTLDWTETLATFAKWQKLTPPYVDKYHVVWWYLDEEMKQTIDLNKWVDSYSEIYVKYERNGSSGWWGWGWSSKKTDKDTHWSAEDSQKNTQDDKNTENVIQSETKWSEESSNTHVDSSDKSSEWQEILSPSDSPSSAGQVSFTKEQKDAYTFAKENWITTKDTIQSAQMNGKLTRIAMAKMLSQYAINVLWQTPDTSKTIKFKDVTSKKDADYDNGVTLAYQLWIMWQNMPNNKFRPNDEVSRAEFATALSRLLYQTTDGEYKSTSKYYTPHMAKLYNEWIINNTDPSMKERRWYVMIMLMRSAEK